MYVSEDFTLVDSELTTQRSIVFHSYQKVVPNFFESSKVIKGSLTKIDYSKLIYSRDPVEIRNSNSFFVGAAFIKIISSSITSALVYLIANDVNIVNSQVVAVTHINYQEAQKIMFFNDICGEDGGSNYNLGGLPLPKTVQANSNSYSYIWFSFTQVDPEFKNNQKHKILVIFDSIGTICISMYIQNL